MAYVILQRLALSMQRPSRGMLASAHASVLTCRLACLHSHLHALGGEAQEVKEAHDAVVDMVHVSQLAQAVVPTCAQECVCVCARTRICARACVRHAERGTYDGHARLWPVYSGCERGARASNTSSKRGCVFDMAVSVCAFDMAVSACAFDMAVSVCAIDTTVSECVFDMTANECAFWQGNFDVYGSYIRNWPTLKMCHQQLRVLLSGHATNTNNLTRTHSEPERIHFSFPCIHKTEQLFTRLLKDWTL
eukprot:1158706-Pelagomonas_calceolata.AAC.5